MTLIAEASFEVIEMKRYRVAIPSTVNASTRFVFVLLQRGDSHVRLSGQCSGAAVRMQLVSIALLALGALAQEPLSGVPMAIAPNANATAPNVRTDSQSCVQREDATDFLADIVFCSSSAETAFTADRAFGCSSLSSPR